MTVGRQSLGASVAGLAVLMTGASYAWAWGNDGHQIVARIAALNLTPKAQRHVAQLLGVSSGPTSVANAMARAAVWPDTYLEITRRSRNPGTSSTSEVAPMPRTSARFAPAAAASRRKSKSIASTSRAASSTNLAAKGI